MTDKGLPLNAQAADTTTVLSCSRGSQFIPAITPFESYAQNPTRSKSLDRRKTCPAQEGS